MPPMNGNFDARSITPKQGGGAHPVGNKFPFRITSTEIQSTKDNSGGMFVVELTSDAGSIKNRYNLWNQNETARKIANEQLSALCHAVNVFQLNWQDEGKALIGAQGLMDIGFQKGHEPSEGKPEGGYVELKKVYMPNGNEPGQNNNQQNNASGGQNWNNGGNGASQGTNQSSGPANTQGSGGNNSNNGQNAQQSASPSNNSGWGNSGSGAAPSENPPWNS